MQFVSPNFASIMIAFYANLPENRSGFWVSKVIDNGRLRYVVFHQGMAEWRDSISEAKQKLHERSEKLLRDRQAKRAIDSIEKLSAIQQKNREMLASSREALHWQDGGVIPDNAIPRISSESDYTWLKHCQPQIFK